MPSPLGHGGLVYLVRDNGLLQCRHARTGAGFYLQWLHADHYYASPVLAEGRVYVSGRGGTTRVVKAGRYFEFVATNTLDDPFTASPAVAGGCLYLRGFGWLYAIGEGSKGR